jgi:flagellar hook-associated protein 2
MAGTVSMAGLSSGTDWTSLIDDLINAQKSASVTPLQTSKTKYQTKLSAWQTFNSKISTITDYLYNNKLNTNEGYNAYSSTLYSSDTSITASNILSVSLGTVSGPGKYSIEVSNLAQAEKISSDVFASNTTALGLSGDIILNNKIVTLSATDTLNNVASLINNASAGITATVIAVSGTEYRLFLESNSKGVNGMSIKNGSSTNLLESLNLHTSVNQLDHASGADALSDTFTSKTSAVGTLLGLTAAETGTVGIRGTDDVVKNVAINLATDSLETIVSNINLQTPTGVTASIEEVTESGTTSYRIKLTNTDINDFTDDNNVLETLGVLEGTRKNSIRTGQDAAFKVDGYSITSSSNTVTDAISGITLTLKGTNAAKPIELRIEQDDTQAAQKVSTLVNNLNSVLSYVKDQNTFSSSTTKPLMGDVNLSLVRSTIASAIYSTISGNNTYKTASSIGISFLQDGTISVNSSTLSAALAANREETLNVLTTVNDNLYDNLKLYIDPLTGTLTSTVSSIQSNITSIDKRITDTNARYERQRELMEKKYNALELLISKSNMTKSWLTQQVNYMSKSTG